MKDHVMTSYTDSCSVDRYNRWIETLIRYVVHSNASQLILIVSTPVVMHHVIMHLLISLCHPIKDNVQVISGDYTICI